MKLSNKLARSIQNWGEQDPRIHSEEMKRWRKAWKLGDKRCAGQSGDCKNEATLGSFCQSCADEIPL